MIELTQKLLMHCVIVGIITIIVGYFTEKTLYNNGRRNNFLTKLKHNYATFILALFIFGCLTHLFFEMIGFEAYCEERCQNDVCRYTCHIGFKSN